MLGTLPNRNPTISTRVRVRTPYSGACPVSGYPLPGSWIEVQYTPADCILELSAVAQHVPTYATEAIDVETVAQLLCRDCAEALGVAVSVEAFYRLRDGVEMWVQTWS
jgi:NADPH-dependent 7-cyano-7-deazaguanine reductase QueF